MGNHTERRKIAVFKPSIVNSRSAFECQALIYRFLQEKYDYRFTIIKAEDDEYEDSDLKTISIPDYAWRTVPFTPWMRAPILSTQRLRGCFKGADGIITVDPTAYPQGLRAIEYANSAGKPVWFDASLTHTGQGGKLYWKLMWRAGMRKAINATTGIIMTVPKCLERFSDLEVLTEQNVGKFRVMGHPVDTLRFYPNKDTSQRKALKIVVVSRLIPEKGHFYILEALTPILKKNRALQLLIVGKGPLRNLVEREIKARALDDQVLLTNPVLHEELPAVLNAADIYVNHAVSTAQWEEYFGASNLEAMACGIPCVLSECGGIPYVVREKGVAVSVKERDIIGLRTAVEKLVESECMRKEMGVSAREYVETNYSLPVIAERYKAMLDEGFEPLCA